MVMFCKRAEAGFGHVMVIFIGTLPFFIIHVESSSVYGIIFFSFCMYACRISCALICLLTMNCATHTHVCGWLYGYVMDGQVNAGVGKGRGKYRVPREYICVCS